jgi:ketosteroid isomerase-like protein
MAAPERNIELARDGLDAFNRGDAEAVLAFIDPEIECRVTADLMNSGTWRGIGGYQEMIAGWNDAWDELVFEVRELEAIDDRHVLAHIRQTAVGRESGVPVAMDVVFLFEVAEDRARRFQIHADRDSAIDAV